MAEEGIETEAKWRAGVREHHRLRRALRQMGATHIVTADEVNALFDTDSGELKRRGQVLRLRWQEDGQTLLTFKGPATFREGIKMRSETELLLRDRSAMIGVLKGLGFSESLEYRKRRETWDLGGVEVTLDTLEFGRFVEIEGTSAQIRHAARLLGLDMERAETRGYPGMTRAYRTRKNAG
jgi:adenylate cyclase class 2